ncbi:RHS repeat-associated core domain-containing protein [Streptomyces sp. NPDC001642]|uniref:RHS repeat-associated core domain-containing protein n=1 Tax=Streptomyces sp. NPDC001642 TaxID=3154392 RepID=UPI00332C33F8
MGSYQRDSGTLSGITLMGVRLYGAGSGRFLQGDPVYGGNDNSYEYCRGNPVSCTDLSGAYSYSYTYHLGGYFSSAKTVLNWIRNHFWVRHLSTNNTKPCVLSWPVNSAPSGPPLQPIPPTGPPGTTGSVPGTRNSAAETRS